MRIVYFANNIVGYQILDWLLKQGEEVVGLVLHPAEDQKFASEITERSGLDSAQVFKGTSIDEPETISAIRELKPDIALSVLFGYIFQNELIKLFPNGVINLHPAYLPYNKGQYPNIWSIVDKTPAGVSLHYIDEGIDTGDLIAQQKVEVQSIDTGETLYRKLERAAVELFCETWPAIISGAVSPMKQSDEGSFHKTSDVEKIREIDLEREYKARDLIDVMRALSFPPHDGAYFIEDGKKVFVRLSLHSEDE